MSDDLTGHSVKREILPIVRWDFCIYIAGNGTVAIFPGANFSQSRFVEAVLQCKSD